MPNLMKIITLLFASMHMVIAAALGAMIITEARWFAWPWFLLWIALFFGGGFCLNYVFGSRYGKLPMNQHLAVASAGPLLLIFISGWRNLREFQSGSLLQIAITIVVIIASANLFFLPSWVGFLLASGRRARQTSATTKSQ